MLPLHVTLCIGQVQNNQMGNIETVLDNTGDGN